MKTAKGGRKHRSAVSFCCDSSFAAPRGGRDANPPADYDVNPISTRAPRTGRDERAHLIELGVYLFQFSRPVWGATRPTLMVRYISSYFNPRAPCGARQRGANTEDQGRRISILAPRAGRDGSTKYPDRIANRFQSSRPVRGATWMLLLTCY